MKTDAQKLTEYCSVRLSHEDMAAVDKWRHKQPELPPRTEAMRRLVDYALTRLGEKT